MVALSEIKRKVIIEGEPRNVKETTSAVGELTRAHGELGRVIDLQKRRMEMDLQLQARTAQAYREQARSAREAAVANEESGSGFKAVVEGAQLATKAALTIGSVAVAAGIAMRGLAAGMMFLRIGAPVLLGLQALNMLWERGAALVDRYAEAQRKVDRSDLAANLADLTKHQGDEISASQVRYASELGERLANAKFTIEQFFKVQLDLTDPALALQSVWVKIVETIAFGVTKVNELIGALSRASPAAASIVGKAAISAIPGLGQAYNLYQGWNNPGGKQDEPGLDQLRSAGLARLGSAMGVANIGKDGAPLGASFGARFGDSIYQLGNVKKETEEVAKATSEARDAWDRAVDSLSRNIALQEADARAVGLNVGEHAKLRAEAQLTEAAQRAGININGEYAETYKKLAERAGEAAIALERARVNNQIGFDRSTMFMSDGDRQIAGQLRSLYPDANQAIASSEASAIRLNQQLTQMRDIGTEFASGFSRDIVTAFRNGETGAEAFTRALTNGLNRIADTLMDMAVRQLAAKALGGMAGGMFGTSQGFPTVDASNQFAAAFPTPIGHSGGVLGQGEGDGMRFVHPAYYEMAPRFHSGRLPWNPSFEMPAIIRKDEGVFTPAQMRALGSRGSASVQNNINIENQGASVEVVEQKQNESGGTDFLIKVIDSRISEKFGGGRMDGVMRSRYGVSPRTRRGS